MKNPFTAHPTQVGETYLEHMKFASTFGFKMMLGGFACLLHAIFPFIFKKTGSDILLSMCQNFVDRQPYLEGKIVKLSEAIELKKRKI